MHDRQFSIAKRQVKAAAFEADARGQKSVFRVTDIDEPERWRLGVEQMPDSTIQARGDIGVAEVHAEALRFEIDAADHFRHVNIVGWPGERSLMKLKAAQIALKARFVLRPS